MSNNYRSIIFLPLFMLGCAPNVINENKVIQKIDSLDMTIFSKNGDKIYSITSPNSSYDNIELKFELKKPIIHINNGAETKYIISSEESTLSDNNKLLNLKGNVKLKTLKKDEFILNADNFIWNIESTRIIGLLLLPLLPELSSKINEQLGSIYREEIPWKQQLSWGLLESNSSLPKPTPIINKLEYDQHL